jgi:hypothetical protein
MTIGDTLWTVAAAFVVWVGIEILVKIYELCQMACAVGAHGW